MVDHRPFSSMASLSDPHGAGLSPSLVVDTPGGDRPSDFPALAGLASSAPPTRSLASNQVPRGSSDGASSPCEPRRHRRLQIREHRSSLLTARRDHRPDPLAPAVAALAPRPLRDQPVDHHEPDRLLRQVVRRLHPRRRDEPEVALPVRLQPLRQVAGWPASPARPASRAAAPRPAPPPVALRNSASRPLLPPVDHREQRPATPRAAAPHRPGPARRAASSGTSHRGSGAPGRTGGPRRTRDGSGDRPRSSRSPAPRRTPSPAPRSARRALRVGSILNSVYSPARKHQVHCRWPLCLCPVSSTLSTACPGRSPSNSS